MLILGISGLSYQATAALIKDGEIVAACEEAKLIGRRSPAGVPHKAIEFCLKQAGAAAEDVDGVAVDLQPLRLLGRELAFRGARFPVAPLASLSHGIAGLNRARLELRDLRTLRDTFPKAKLTAVEHHYAHAAYAYYPSALERALVITLDSGSVMRAGAVWLAEGGRIEQRAAAPFPHSIGLLYSSITALLGWNPADDVHRTVWLSATGEPEFADVFRRILAPLRRGEMRINAGCFSHSVAGRVRLSDSFLKSIGVQPSGDQPSRDRKGAENANPPETWRANLAASLQTEAEAALVEFAEFWRKRTGAEALCLGGGVAFNTLLAEALASRTGFREGFIPPAAGNAGCAVGAAMAATQTAGGTLRRSMMSASLGPSYSGQYIKDILDNCRLRYKVLAMPQMVEAVAELLNEGLFVGWFQGAAEFGPRALGHRSILAVPRDHWVKENLNAYTKRREAFRPLAASVTEEAAPKYFDYRWAAPAAYLATVARVKDAEAIPGLAFQGGRARIQIVSRASNKYFHELLTRVGQFTGHPVLINTSFNQPGAPLAATPGEALRVFYSSGIDALAIGNFLIRK
jgi:carbamoyltransferase